MVEKSAEAQDPVHRPRRVRPELPISDDEGLRRGTQCKSGDDNSEDPRKTQARVGEPIHQEDGDLRNRESEDHIRMGGGVGPRNG